MGLQQRLSSDHNWQVWGLAELGRQQRWSEASSDLVNISLGSSLDPVIRKQEVIVAWGCRRREGSCPSPVLPEQPGEERCRERAEPWAPRWISEDEEFHRKLGSTEEGGKIRKGKSHGLTNSGIFST